jgi:hypothetical protein
VYPLFATTGVAVGICVMQLVRNITTNPEVRYYKNKSKLPSTFRTPHFDTPHLINFSTIAQDLI